MRTTAVAGCRGRCRLAVWYSLLETYYLLSSHTCLLQFVVKYRCGESYCIASHGPSNNCMALYTPLPLLCHRRAENWLRPIPNMRHCLLPQFVAVYRRWWQMEMRYKMELLFTERGRSNMGLTVYPIVTSATLHIRPGRTWSWAQILSIYSVSK
jgi:hypothetical protein